jgi:hypothetical protein
MIEGHQIEVRGFDSGLNRRIAVPTGQRKMFKNLQQMEDMNKKLRRPWQRFYLAWVREKDLGQFSIRR